MHIYQKSVKSNMGILLFFFHKNLQLYLVS